MTPARAERYSDWAAAAAIVIVAALCLAFRYLPMVDLPQHYAMVSVLIHYRDPTYGFADRYTFDFLGRPYATVYVVAAALAQIFPLGVAMRIVVALCTIAPLVGVFVLLRALGRPREWTLLGVPFAFGSLWHWGFLNFLLGTGLFLIGLSIVIALARQRSLKKTIALAILAVVLLFTHFHGLLMLVLVAPLFVWACSSPAAPRRALVRPLLPLLPAALGAALFVLSTWAQAEGHWRNRYPGPLERLRRFSEFLGEGIAGPWPVVTLLAAGLVAGAALLVTRGRDTAAPPQRERAAALAALGLQIALYFVLPLNTNTATYVSARHALLIVLFALPLLPKTDGLRRSGLSVAAALVAMTSMVFVFLHLSHFDHEARDFDRVLAAMQQNRKVLPMIYDNHGGFTSHRTFPYLHFAGYYQAAKGGDLAQSFALVWNVPIRYRPDYRRYVVPDAAEWSPNWLRLDDLLHFDYLLARGTRAPIFPPSSGLHSIAQSGEWTLFENPVVRAP